MQKIAENKDEKLEWLLHGRVCGVEDCAQRTGIHSYDVVPICGKCSKEMADEYKLNWALKAVKGKKK